MMLKNGFFIIVIFFVLSCGKEEGDILSVSSEAPATQEPFLVLAGQDGNHRGLTYYDLSGNFIRATHFREESGLPRGMVAIQLQCLYRHPQIWRWTKPFRLQKYHRQW